MPGFTVTRGFGPGASPSNLIARGFIPAEVVQVLRGAYRKTKQAKQQIGEFLEELKVTAMLVAINGKDLVKPIINVVRTSYNDEPTPEIRVTPTKLAVRQPDIKVKVTQVRNKDVNN